MEYLGLKIQDLYDFEVPREIFSHRGLEADEDNVVFYYEGGFYLFLFDNRVWQVRFDRTSEQLPLNLTMGDNRDKVLSQFLDEGLVPLLSQEEYITFQIRHFPWPVRVRLYFSDRGLDDVYLYRSDF